jgi:hypothetical protein
VVGPHSAAKDTQMKTQTQQSGLLISMEVSKGSRSDPPFKDIYGDIVSRFDATQRSQASIIQKLCTLIEECRI